MPSVQIGKYKRPGIFIEEFNSSVIETPNVTGIQSLVIGSSKKGPINTPVAINSQIELDRIFGQLDRTLESSGSYFHRTISKLLENTPVIAMNILNVDDDLDQIEYKSISTSTGYENDIKRNAPYSRFFDTSTFWKRDREAFLGITQDNPNDDQRILHFTNLNDRQITVFIVKTQDTTGFDRTLLDWFGSVDNVPVYLDARDYASDYLVDVVVLSGDWTNYNQLSVDPKWSQYFNNSGLVKDQLFELVNDQSINALGVWRNLSVIPFFRDANGTNIFIEDRINQRTDETGLFCAFDIDAVETTFRNGLFDLLGNSLIGNNAAESIDFLSYQESIIETVAYPETKLDSAGNVNLIGFNDYYQGTATDRKALYAEGFVGGLQGIATDTISATGATGVGIATFSVGFTASTYVGGGENLDPYAVIGGQVLSIETTSFDITPSSITDIGSTQSIALYIDTDGGIKQTSALGILSGSEIVLGLIEVTVQQDSSVNYFETLEYTPISVDENAFVYFDSNDVTTTVLGNEITYEFLQTSGVVGPSDPLVYRRVKLFNDMLSVLSSANSDRATILVDGEAGATNSLSKLSIADLSVTLTNTTASNKAIKLGGFDANFFDSSILESNGLVLHTLDNEMVMGTNGLRTSDIVLGATYGLVGRYSDLYTDYVNGSINTGDYFYENLIDPKFLAANSRTLPTYIRLMDVSGDDYIVADQAIEFSNGNVIKLTESTTNTGELIVDNIVPITSGLTGATGSYFGYLLSSNVTEETIVGPTKLMSVTDTNYTRFYLDGTTLNVEFTDVDNVAGETSLNSGMDIVSQDSNFRQSVEIESPDGYEAVPNKVLVNGSRYSEIRVGDFLQAVVTDTPEVGEVPRRMTRVIGKVQYSGDASLIELTCDDEIRLYDFDGDQQTYRFTEIDDYVSTYKGINLFGFRVRNASLPDNTDARLDDIMNIVQKGTPLYNALTDKDIIDYRYLVDSYGLGLSSTSKQQLADICGKRLDCFGILNMPSMKQFRNSTSPSFVDSENRLSVEYISLGGNPEESAAFNYSLAEGDGSTSVGYFTPYVTVNDNGRPKEVPPAAYVATTFLRKHNTSLTSVTPWTIAAGITDGQVTSIAGLEYSFTSEDIEYLNGMSVNPIVSKRNRGRVIETENTAETLANSALGLIHVREVLIELERSLSDMLLNFQWKYNTPEIRAEIKLRADVICEDFVNRNGLFNFFNKIDSENNTQEIIDNQIGVLDTYVEPIKGMGIIVNNITILNTGGIESNGFL